MVEGVKGALQELPAAGVGEVGPSHEAGLFIRGGIGARREADPTGRESNYDDTENVNCTYQHSRALDRCRLK